MSSRLGRKVARVLRDICDQGIAWLLAGDEARFRAVWRTARKIGFDHREIERGMHRAHVRSLVRRLLSEDVDVADIYLAATKTLPPATVRRVRNALAWRHRRAIH